MKKYFFVVLAIVCSSTTIFAQNKAPKAVEMAFNIKFPKATKVKWGKESPNEYEADFTENGIKYSANFSAEGKWLETESPVFFENIPAKIQTEFNNSHKGAKIKAVAKIETSNGEIQYEIEIKKGLKTIEFFYNTEGKLIK